jgi:hypothetical protein
MGIVPTTTLSPILSSLKQAGCLLMQDRKTKKRIVAAA